MEDEREKTENLSEASIYRVPIMNQCATGFYSDGFYMATGSQITRAARRSVDRRRVYHNEPVRDGFQGRVLIWRRVLN